MVIGLAFRVISKSVHKSRVGLVEAGRFWCLYCEGEHGYQLREWSHTKDAVRGMRFVRCDACQATFDPECLDESSTKSCDELMVGVPEFAYGPAEVPTWASLLPLPKEPRPDGEKLAEYLGWQKDSPEVTGE